MTEKTKDYWANVGKQVVETQRQEVVKISGYGCEWRANRPKSLVRKLKKGTRILSSSERGRA